MTDLIRAALNNCNPQEPLKPGDSRCVDLTKRGVRGDDSDVVSLLRTQIDRSDEPSQQILTGFCGCGKTTELLRLKEDLERQGYVVVYVDTEEYLNLRVPADLADIWIVIAAAVDDAIFANSPPDPARPFDRFWERLRALLTTEIGLREATVKVPAVGDLKFSFTTGDFRASLYAALGERRSELVKQCRGPGRSPRLPALQGSRWRRCGAPPRQLREAPRRPAQRA